MKENRTNMKILQKGTQDQSCRETWLIRMASDGLYVTLCHTLFLLTY